MTRLQLSIGLGESDRIRPLLDGQVQPQGADLTLILGKVGEIFWRMLRYRDFSAAEMSLAAYAIQYARGNRDFVALPVFPSRMFRHSAIYISTASGIREPGDLAGRRIGVQEYQMTACVWVRGMLLSEYGVRAQDIHWFTGGLERPGREERIPLRLPPEYKVESIARDQTLSAMLASGQLDAVISPEVPAPFRAGDPGVQRLFPDARAAEMDYFRRTGVFPIMHALVMQRNLYDQHPWVARELTRAFTAAKDLAMELLDDTDHLRTAVAWLPHAAEEQRQLMGPDPWPYGMAKNRRTLELFLGYCAEQGLLEQPVAVDDLFAPNTLDDVTFH